MKYKQLLTILNGQMEALIKEEEFTAERMFAAATEKETVLLLRKVEGLRERYNALQGKISTIVFWNKRLEDKRQLESSIAEQSYRRTEREYEKLKTEASKPLKPLQLDGYLSKKIIKKLKRSSK